MSTSTTTALWPRPYPPARRSDHVDVYDSAKDGKHDGPETEAWTTVQERFTREFLDAIPERKILEDKIRENINYAKFSSPSLKNDGRWYWYYNSGLQAQYTLYRSRDSTLPDFTKNPEADAEVFFDANLLAEDGTASLGSTSFAPSGEHWAYSVSRSGSDSVTIYVRPTSSPYTSGSHDDGRLADELKYIKFSSITWDLKSEGFFYQRFPQRDTLELARVDKIGAESEKDEYAMLYYHRLGTSQSDDLLILKDDKNPQYRWSAHIAEIDRRYLVVAVSADTSQKNLLWICDLANNEIGPDMKWHKVVDKFHALYTVIAIEGTKLYTHTNKDADQFKLITIDLADESWTETDLIPEDKGACLEQVVAVSKDRLAVVYKRDVKDEVYVYELSSGKQLARVASDFVGTMSISGDRRHPWFFVNMTGFTTPAIIGQYDFTVEEKEGRWAVRRQADVRGLRPEDFVAEQRWYASKDGTKVPMFIVRHKATKVDGTAPAIQYGYGGFGISVNPFWSPALLTVIERYGGVLAVANIRGGGEFGEAWHLAGTKERKHNCFDDFIAATEFLVENKYAAPGKVAINGGSNGGLLVAASAFRAPEGTFGAVVSEVGVHDMLKFSQFTIGHAWRSDYGDPQKPEDFDFIKPISPLHNVSTDKTLPPTILLTADHDDRVVPLHSFKLAATLQHLHPQSKHPLLIRIQKKAGHGAGKSTEQAIKEAADKWGFVVQTMGLVPKSEPAAHY
ncbi:hypothetical protein PUNSTDRAFT_142274 [Punctularia strigosozonata HHB-11173 SS5]|uniref:uncharacterized protein n=1 Tax=Punctularia strigosozonata (strain HHB-11173) TaxID=741275 RepID=UPI0004418206|nr:uncharacterized protein PUNSTDRAFT_142274 [Punctularia strigosozonata HHB-11173 SS5]EIN10182.1 hypothetical protein PUNSTDRAFT_142274 [Punctularia strigosozonata HHB-11173 SS5]